MLRSYWLNPVLSLRWVLFSALIPAYLATAATTTLRLAVNPWTGSAVDAAVARILLQERLGYQVDLVAIDEFAQFPALARGELDATLEVWPSGHADDRRFYIDGQKTVEDLGPLGVVGKIGWYIPSYLLAIEPTLNTWQGLKAHSGLFKTSASGLQGQLLEGDPSWVYHDQDIIDSLGLNLKIVQTGSEAALIAAVETAFAHHDPILFYFWTPHSLHSRFDLTKVELPARTPGCTGCEYPSDTLYKAVSATLRQRAPAAYRLLQQMKFRTEDQIAMIADVDLHDQTPEVAARNWIRNHEAAWSSWFPISSNSSPTVIPPPANLWAAHNLIVIDKDTNAVFLNANERFLSTLRPSFPEIQTATDLAGRDDFYFYPPEQAEKFRADDRRVIATGKTVVTTEVNQPVGGTRTVAHVTKVPLRDEHDRIYGLRVVAYDEPPIEIRAVAAGVEIGIPVDATIFHLERTSTLGSTLAWSFVDIAPVMRNNELVFQVEHDSAEGYFRLTAQRPVSIGALLSLTGNWSSLGQNCRAALDAGLEAANLVQLASGSPLTFEADVRDTLLQPDTALAQLQQLAARGVKTVVGPQSSAELRILKPYADANGIILISPSSTASSLAIEGDYLFRFCPDDTYEAEAMVALLKADGIQAVVPIWRDDAGNDGLHDSMARLFPAAGGSITTGVEYGQNQNDFTGIVTELARQVSNVRTNHPGGSTAVYLAGFDEVASIFHLARTDPVLNSVKWYGSDGVVQSLPLAADAAAAQFAVERGYPNPTFGLDERYRGTWEPIATLLTTRTGNVVDAFTLAGFDAVQVLVKTYRAAGFAADSGTLKTAFINAAQGYIGATGLIQLNAAGDRAGGAFDFWSLRNGSGGYEWYRSISYEPSTNGPGAIVRFP